MAEQTEPRAARCGGASVDEDPWIIRTNIANCQAALRLNLDPITEAAVEKLLAQAWERLMEAMECGRAMIEDWR
jgi:hypothetical protein